MNRAATTVARRLAAVAVIAMFGASSGCFGASAPDAGRSVAPKGDGAKGLLGGSNLVGQASLEDLRARAQVTGWQEGQRNAIAGAVLQAQVKGPDEFRRGAWGRLSLVVIVMLVFGMLARIALGMHRPRWWAWLRRRSGGLDDVAERKVQPGSTSATKTVDGPSEDPAKLPSLAAVAARNGWRAIQTAVRRVGQWTLGPAPRDHVWRREIHQSRDAERDLRAAALLAEILGKTETPAQVGPVVNAEPVEADDNAPAKLVVTKVEESSTAEPQPPSTDAEATSQKSATPTQDPKSGVSASKDASGTWQTLASALVTWRGEVTDARRRLTAMEPMDHERALLHALDTTQALAAEIRVTLTRVDIAGDAPASAAVRDVWLRRIQARPDLPHLAPPAPKLAEGADWGGWAAVGGLTASALGIVALAAWAAAGALPLFVGVVLCLAGPVTYGVARLQLDRTGRPRLLPGVADRLATRVATTALLVGLVLWGSTWFGDEINLGKPPAVEQPMSLQVSVNQAFAQQQLPAVKP